MSDMKRIWLRAARRRAGLTQQELSVRIGKRQSVISRLETGNLTNPSLRVVVALGRAVGVDPWRLRFYKPEEPVALLGRRR